MQANERAATKTDRRDANRLGELLWVNRARIAAGQRVPGLKWIKPRAAQIEVFGLAGLYSEHTINRGCGQ